MNTLYYHHLLFSQRSPFMSVKGNIHEILQQIQFLIRLYGDATFLDIQHSVAIVRSK